MQKCKSISSGITAPDVLLGKKQKYVKSKNWSRDQFQQKISPFEKFVAKYVFFFYFLKFQSGTVIKKQTYNKH